MLRRQAAFTLVELAIVILTLGIFAAAMIPAMRGRVDRAKWTEAQAAAGAIRRAVRACRQEACGMPDVVGKLDDVSIQDCLGFTGENLDGTYFGPADYQILKVTDQGLACIKVTGSRPNAPVGSRILNLDGSWTEEKSLAESLQAE